MNADTNISNDPGSGIARPAPDSRRPLSTQQLNPKYLGLAFGLTGLVFYLGCVLTMAIAPHKATVVFFNSLLHGLDVEPILNTSVPLPQVALGLVTTFILGCIAGMLIAGIYNLCLRRGNDAEAV